MRHSTLTISIASLIVLPVTAFAVALSPAALLQQMTFRGNPHMVDAEFHIHADDTHVSLWMKGAAEGKTPATAKAWEEITVDIASDGEYVRARGAMRLVSGKVYLKLLSLEGDTEDLEEILAWTQKPWVVIEIPETAVEQQTFAAGFAAGMRSSGIDVSEEDVRAMMDTVADALFTMETTRFQGGAAYSLKLAPDYLQRAMTAFVSSTVGQQVGWDAEDAELPEDMPPVNLHIRVNTNTAGELTFLKWYAATDFGGASLVMQGSSQWQGHPVYVEIPKDVVPVEELVGDVEDMMDGAPLEIFGRELPMMEEEEMEWKETPVWEEEEREPMELPRRVPMKTLRIRRLEASRPTPDCTATPGTSFYLQQARKGLCDLPARSEYRVNDDGLGKALNPRTSRLKNY